MQRGRTCTEAARPAALSGKWLAKASGPWQTQPVELFSDGSPYGSNKYAEALALIPPPAELGSGWCQPKLGHASLYCV